ncbi:uncharacterized protein LOC113291656 [Papaver somniferum]|uniref:uncharacterized protein LOC113291656 n=1 Tax=Papaver somniferum TaxID=3469 RepID=UPI000E7044D0|nr:uncharacterized protein LOC113291656 [Papaver somniferum]
MPFGLKNSGATYQRMVEKVFAEWIHKTLEVYFDNMLVKSKKAEDHVDNLREIFEQMRKFNVKVNPEKCVFGVSSGKILGYIISKEGIEVHPEKVQAVRDMPPPATIKDVQKLNGLIASLGRFFSRSSDKCDHFFNILKKGTKFVWTEECDKALQSIKNCLMNLSIMQKAILGEELLLYLASKPSALSAVLIHVDQGVEKPIYYISKAYNSAEINYSKIEKLIPALVYASFKLRIYFQAHKIKVLTRVPIELTMKNSRKSGRIERWNALSGNYNISYEVLSSPKSQVIVEFLAEFPVEEDEYVEDMMDVDEEYGNPKDLLTDQNPNRWEILVDGSSNGEGNGIGIVFISPKGVRIAYSFRVEVASTNNETKYEAVIHALKLAIEMQIKEARITSDSQLVIRQIEASYSTNEPSLQKYKKLVSELAAQIQKVSWRDIGRKDNRFEDALAFIPSMLVYPVARDLKIQTLYWPSVKKEEEEEVVDAMIVENIPYEQQTEEEDWRTELHLYLEKGELPRNRLEAHKLKSRATNYELRDSILYRRSFLGPSLRCLIRKECIEILKALHYGDAGNHSGGRSLAYKARIQGYYWPYMHEYAKKVSRRCEECQRHGKRIHAPGAMLNNSVNAWPFGRWGIDIVGPFIPGTRKRRYLIVYFTKWAEVKAVQHIRDKDIFTFIFENIICRFGIPAQLVSDNGKHNGQAEATKKMIADTLKKKLEGHNKGWCEKVHNVV